MQNRAAETTNPPARTHRFPMFSTVMKPLLSPSPSLFRLPPLSSSLSVLFHVFPFSSSSSPFHSPHPITPLRSSRRNYIPHHASLSDHYLSCSVPEKPLRVAVLLSGGVDSSVALRLLHAAGHSCTAFYLKIWFQVCVCFFISCLCLETWGL